MTYQPPRRSVSIPPAHCPAHTSRPPRGKGLPRLYGPQFAADPTPTYATLRRMGPAAWAEIDRDVEAIVVTSYTAALKVLRDPVFGKDSRHWRALNEGRVPPDSAVLALMAWRPSCLYADDDTPEQRHTRLRGAVDDAWSRIDPHALRRYVEQAADRLIDHFAPRGTADLVHDYADQLLITTFTQLFGCPASLLARMATACDHMIDAEPTIAHQGSADLAQCLGELVTLKRHTPGQDVTSHLLAHPAQLTDEEMVHQLVVLIGAGTVPTSTWISNALRLLLTDDRFAGTVGDGSLPVADALDEVLWRHSPMANFSVHYARSDTELDGVPIPAGVPILISHAAVNTDPAVGHTTHHHTGNRAHLAFSAGPHTCPAREATHVIATAAIERLLDRLPNLDLAAPVDKLTWRHGPFHRALTALPVRFPPAPGTPHPTTTAHTTTTGGSAWNPESEPSSTPSAPTTPRTAADWAPTWNTSPAPSSIPPVPTSTPKPPASAPKARRSWWNFPGAYRRGR